MIAAVLVALGVAVLIGSLFASRLTRAAGSRSPSPRLADDDPWAAFSPRAIEDIDRERPRLWPVLACLSGLALVAGGVVVDRPLPESETMITGSEPSPEPYLIEVSVATAPTPEPTPEPSPEPSPTPTPSGTSGAGAATAPAPGQPSGSGGTADGPAPTSAPEPTPSPVPGPAIGASTACFNGALQINYTAQARSGTTLQTLRLDLDGQAVKQPSVGGHTQYSGSYQTNGRGSHTFALTVTQADGGVSRGNYPIHCS